MKKFFLPFSFVTLFSSISYGQITLTAATAATAVSNFIGTGVTVSNIQYTGVANSLATFSGPSNLGITNGITFGTGGFANINSPASYFHSDPAAGPGDPTLQAVIGAGGAATQDAAVLEFDFTSLSDSVHFEYVFGSEEYNDYVNSQFNDVFGFFVSGPGIVGQQNIALIPGTSTIVSINNVNNGYSAAAASGPCNNCAYFYDNVNQPAPTTCMDGITTVLRANMQVKVCETYHIKLAIANVGDGAFDSQVFLKANSFSSSYVNIYPTGGVQVAPNISTICPNDSILITASNSVNYLWPTGDTVQSIWVNNSMVTQYNGQFSVIVIGVGNGCILFSTPYIVINDIPQASISPAGLVTLCPGDSAALTANSGSSYLWSNGATSQQIMVGGSGTFTVTVTDSVFCDAVSPPVTVNAGTATAIITPVGPTAICQGGSVTLQANNGASYLWSNGATTQNMVTSTAGNYTVTVTQAGGCSAVSAPQNVAVSVPAASITPQGPLTFCQGSSVTLAANAGSSWLWSNGATTQNITVSTTGNFTVTVTNAGGCDTASAPVSVTVNSATATITNNGSLMLCPGQQANLSANAGASYLWSNGATTQSITPSIAGNYTVTVTSANNCTATSAPVAIAVSNPTATITPAGSTSICPGNSVTLNANAGNSYLWSNGATTASITAAAAGSFTVTVTNTDNCTAVSLPVSVSVTPPSASITPAGPTTFCQGGSVTLNANAGASWLWSTGATTQSISPTAAGSYIVTVTNANGCDTVSLPVNVVVNTGSASITLTGPSTICPGAQANLMANAGSSYLWSNGATTQGIAPTTAGNYVVTVTDINTCVATSAPVAIAVSNPTATITPAGSTSICPGNSVTLNANAGNSYLWSNGATTASITAAAAGSFTVTVTNTDNCTAVSLPVSVSVTPPSASITPAGPTTFCQGGSVTLNANAGASWLWSTGATTQSISPTAAGSYIVTVTNANGCDTVSLPVNVVVNTGSASITLTGPSTICPGAQANLMANAGASYLWSNGATTQGIAPTTAGNYVVTVTDINTCVATSAPVAIAVSNPTATITPAGSTALCPGNSVALNANAGTSYLWSNGATTASITASGNGSYTVTVTNADNCTAVSAPVAVSTNPPVANITPSGSTTFCQGSNVTLTANAGSAYLWSTGATTQSITPSTAGSYLVTVTSAGGCDTISSPVNVVVNTATASITPAGSTTICPGTSVGLTANAGSAYMWSNGATTQTISASTGGSYIVTVTNLNTCVATSAPVSVTVSNPTAMITPAGSTTLCPGGNVTLNANAGNAWLWSNGATTSSINVSAAGNYTVTVTNVDNCLAVSSPVAIQISAPTASIMPGSSTTFCLGDSVMLAANNGNAYLWSNGATTQNISVLTAGNYVVTVTNIDGCTAVSLQEPVVVNTASAMISALGPVVFCPNSDVTLQANAGAAYLWSNGATTQSITVNQNGTYTATVTNANTCTAVSNSISTLVSLPAAAISASGPTTICPNTTVTLSANPGTSYLWSDGSSSQSITVGQNGSYTATVADSIGCLAISNTISVNVSIPVANITPAGPTTFCDGNSVVLQANNGTAYLWSNGSTSQSIAVFNAGTYDVQVTDTAGCNETSSQVTVTVLFATATATAQGPTVFCRGDQVTITANQGLGYVWNNGETTQTIQANTSGNYYVSVTNNNGCTALSSAVHVDVHEFPAIAFVSDTSLICETLKVKFTNNSTFEGGSTFAWTFGDGTVSDQENPFHVYNAAGQYLITLTITSPVGCESVDSAVINVVYYPPPIAGFSADPTFTTLVNSDIKFTDQSQNAVKWHWDFGDGITSGEPSPTHFYNAEGHYRVTLQIHSLADCIDEKTEEIYVAPFFIPNSFTPNNDGKNEVFFDAHHIMDVDKYSMVIWNRWGEKVFSTDSYDKPWTGVDPSGNPAQNGIYVYVISVNTKAGKLLEYKGTVNLLR